MGEHEMNIEDPTDEDYYQKFEQTEVDLFTKSQVYESKADYKRRKRNEGDSYQGCTDRKSTLLSKAIEMREEKYIEKCFETDRDFNFSHQPLILELLRSDWHESHLMLIYILEPIRVDEDDIIETLYELSRKKFPYLRNKRQDAFDIKRLCMEIIAKLYSETEDEIFKENAKDHLIKISKLRIPQISYLAINKIENEDEFKRQVNLREILLKRIPI